MRWKASPCQGEVPSKARRRGAAGSAATSSVSLRLTASPHRGSLFPLRRGDLSGAARQLPLRRGALGLRTSKAFPYEGKLARRSRDG